MPRHIKFKLLKTKDKEKNVKAARGEKNDTLHTGKTIWKMAYFSYVDTLEARRECDIFIVLKEKNCQPWKYPQEWGQTKDLRWKKTKNSSSADMFKNAEGSFPGWRKVITKRSLELQEWDKNIWNGKYLGEIS